MIIHLETVKHNNKLSQLFVLPVKKGIIELLQGISIYIVL